MSSQAEKKSFEDKRFINKQHSVYIVYTHFDLNVLPVVEEDRM